MRKNIVLTPKSEIPKRKRHSDVNVVAAVKWESYKAWCDRVAARDRQIEEYDRIMTIQIGSEGLRDGN